MINTSMTEVHITYWVKQGVLFYRTSKGNMGSMPVTESEDRTLDRLLKSHGFKNYTLEKV